MIDAVNADVPFDRFVTEQVAGDLLAAESGPERDRLLTATGFLGLGVKDVNQRFKVRFVMDNIDEQIDVVSRSLLGLTVSCARCHDHKFDPIPTTDYYALAGHLLQHRQPLRGPQQDGRSGAGLLRPDDARHPLRRRPRGASKEVEELTAQVEQAKKAWDAIRGTPDGLAKGADGFPERRPYRVKYQRLQGELLALTDPATRGHAVHGVSDAKVVSDTEVRLRGRGGAARTRGRSRVPHHVRGPGRPRRQSEAERTPRARPLARQPEEPPGPQGGRQSGLAPPLRPGDRHDRRQLRDQRRRAGAIPSCSTISPVASFTRGGRSSG